MRKNIFTNITALLICVIFIVSQSAVLVYAADTGDSGFRVTGGSTTGQSSTGTARTLMYNGTTIVGLGEVDGGDMFVNFKGLMPGDTGVEQTVVIQNQSEEPITVYVYAEPTATVNYEYEDTNSFLSYFNMAISHNTRPLYSGSVVDNPTDDTWDQRNPIALGTISRGSQTTLTILLDVSIEMPDDYQNLSGAVRWVFVINGTTYPTNPENPDPDPDPDPDPVDPYTPDPDPPGNQSTSTTPTASPNVVTPTQQPDAPVTPPITPEVSPEITITPEDVPLDNPPAVVIEPTPEAEIIIDDPETPLDAPKTGDEAKIVMWSVLLILFVAALVCMIVIRVKNGQKSSEPQDAKQIN